MQFLCDLCRIARRSARRVVDFRFQINQRGCDLELWPRAFSRFDLERPKLDHFIEVPV